MIHAKDMEFVQEISLSIPPEVVWSALTEPERVKMYHLAPLQKIELKAGGDILYGVGKEVMISGVITEVQEHSRLSHTFRFGSQCQPATTTDGETLVIYELREESGSTILKLTHTGFTEENQTYANIAGGWPYILERLKVWLEKKE